MFVAMCDAVVVLLPDSVESAISQAMSSFLTAPDSAFKVRKNIALPLTAYKTKSQERTQMRHALDVGLVENFPTPHFISYTYYLYAFSDTEMHGPIDTPAREEYFSRVENLNQTLLIDDLRPLYPKCEIAKSLIFVKELKNDIQKLFGALKPIRLYSQLQQAFVRNFCRIFSTTDTIFKTTPGTGGSTTLTYMAAEIHKVMVATNVARHARVLAGNMSIHHIQPATSAHSEKTLLSKKPQRAPRKQTKRVGQSKLANSK